MNKTHPTPYPELNIVLRDLVSSIQSALGSNFTGAYLQGSFAVGDFDECSDVDFIVAIEDDLSDDQVQALQVMHERIFCLDIAWAQHLEGSYFPKNILRDYTHSGSLVWYLDHGSRSLIRSEHCNTILVRWVVRENGVTLAGPAPVTLVDPIPVEALRRDILATIVNWGREILDDSEHFNNRFYQGFIVLSYCRMLHDLRRGCPGSKLAGAEWAKANLDPSWSGLIDRTWATRPDPATSVHTRPDPADFQATLAFVRYVIRESLEYAAEINLPQP
ncbi:MAG: DUF4111 domain-containing protein [Anaerolineae bacterium]|nr:DUF4111 domain-containing protein [Anaerolineae bacterium]